MKRLAALTGVAALVATVGTATPAAAHPGGVCVAVNARAYLSVGIYYPPVIKANVGFEISAGGCVATGTLATSSCGNSIGSGTLDDGSGTHNFTIVTAGGVVTIAGGAEGTLTAVPDVPGGESCMPGTEGADTFIVNGTAVGVA